MSQEPPSWFPKGTPADSPEFQRRKQALLEQLPELAKERANQAGNKDRQPGRANDYYPYLLVRSVLGDRGSRPFNVPFWESPDIWTFQGAPAATPDVPPDHGGQVKAGQPATVYAHVWNLGLAPLAGIYVEFFWFNPSLAIDGTHAHPIGVARCDLAARGMAGSHKLVKCPTAWVPTMENNGHECLMVRISGIGDPVGGNPWQPWLNRHVAQRNVSVVSGGSGAMQAFLGSLDATRITGARLQLLQIGAKEGMLAQRAVASRLRIAALDSHVLGEIAATGAVQRPMGAAHADPAMLQPVHPLIHGGAPAAPLVAAATRVIDPRVSLSAINRFGSWQRHTGPADKLVNAHLADLLAGVGDLHAGGDFHTVPAAGEAQVLRIASYDGDQLVGGYTMVVTA